MLKKTASNPVGVWEEHWAVRLRATCGWGKEEESEEEKEGRKREKTKKRVEGNQTPGRQLGTPLRREERR